MLESLNMELQPNLQTWYLDSEGGWQRDASVDLADLHSSFEQMAKDRRQSAKKSKSGRK